MGVSICTSVKHICERVYASLGFVILTIVLLINILLMFTAVDRLNVYLEIRLVLDINTLVWGRVDQCSMVSCTCVRPYVVCVRTYVWAGTQLTSEDARGI